MLVVSIRGNVWGTGHGSRTCVPLPGTWLVYPANTTGRQCTDTRRPRRMCTPITIERIAYCSGVLVVFITIYLCNNMRWRTEGQVDDVSVCNRRADRTVDKSLLTDNHRASSLPPRAAAAATAVAVAVDDNVGVADGGSGSGPPWHRRQRVDFKTNPPHHHPRPPPCHALPPVHLSSATTAG